MRLIGIINQYNKKEQQHDLRDHGANTHTNRGVGGAFFKFSYSQWVRTTVSFIYL